MILDDVLARLEAVRDKLNASVQKKGVAIPDNSTLYEIDEGVNMIGQDASYVSVTAQNVVYTQATSTLSMQASRASYDDTTNTVNIVTT